jgi:hypothetical protein
MTKPTSGEVKLPGGETLEFYRWDLGEMKRNPPPNRKIAPCYFRCGSTKARVLNGFGAHVCRRCVKRLNKFLRSKVTHET